MHSLFSSLRRSRIFAALVFALLTAVGVKLSAQQQPRPVSSSNINMVSGTTFPDGDPYLQRQNEPNLAVSTSNPLHLLAGANDYRTVDLPGPFDQMRGFKMNADAWVGLFKSVDGGKTWKSTLLPGFPQDTSAEGKTSPLFGREGATDPVIRAGTNGLFYYAGVGFDRGGNRPSSIFVARYIDLNNREAGDPFGYAATNLVDSDLGTRFLDKPALAVDIPRTAATCTVTSRQSGDKPGDPPIQHVRTIPAGNVYVAYVAFTGSGPTEQSVVMLSRSTNCGATWSAPIALSTGSRLVQNPQIAISPVDGAVYVSWRRFVYTSQDNAVMVVKSVNGGATFSKPLRVAGLRAFDLITSSTQFRSNGFQTMAIDATGRVYLAWADRGYAAVRSDPATGDARVVISTSTNGSTWSVPRVIQPDGIGHQLQPAMSFHGGKLRVLYYDLREDVSQVFGPHVDEAQITNVRHTMDVFVAQAAPGGQPVFTTARVSEYASGFLPGSTVEQQMQFNPPNLPMFRQGTVPFVGDYIDLAPSPSFVLNDSGTWSYNLAASGTTVSHAVWTDNRDVRAPADGNWANYTPVTSPEVLPVSRFDGVTPVPSCDPGQVGMRNQNIYTARVTDGLFVSVPGNNKQFNGFQRAFVVVAENATQLPRVFRLRIENQPVGGQASFLQFGPPLTTLDVATPALSSVVRSVFATAQSQNARIRVSVTEVNAVGGTVVTNGLNGAVVLNPDPQSPVLQNPVLQNPVLQNPVLQNISQGESYNPGISAALVGTPNLQNPVLQNPNLQNPNLQNPSIQNPHLQNPNLQNPNLQNPVLQNDAVANPSIVNPSIQNPSLQNPTLQNPNLQNPTLQNPSLQNAGISDTNWVVTNEGNTTASYTVNLLLNNPVPAGFSTQLLIHKTFTTPAAEGCDLKLQPHTILLANIPNPVFVTDVTNPNLQNPNLQNPSLQNPTLALAPGETATVTLRIIDPNIFDGVTYDASGAVTPAAVAQSVNSDDVAAGRTTPTVAIPLTIATTEIPPTTPGAPISRTLQTVAGIGTVTCSVVTGLGELPPGVTLSPAGTLAGTPTAPGNYSFTVECVDSGPPIRRDRQTLSIQVNPAAALGSDALWNGLDNNWYNPANWSPRGVPAPTARVYVSAATTVIPKLTADATIRDLFLEPGATLDTNGFTLTVTNNADAGRTIIGAGQTVLTGNGSVAAGVFSNLVIAGRITLAAPLTTTGTLTLAPGARLELNGQPLIVGGQLVTNATGGNMPIIVGDEGNSFIVTGVNVNGLVLNAAPLTINGAPLTRFDNVSFSGFSPEAIQLTVNNPGLLTHFPMNGLSFSSQPTSGQYISATDTQPGGALLVLDVTGAVPADGSAFTLEAGGAQVNWLGIPGQANLAVTQSVAPVPATAGTRLTYQITVTNGGPVAAANVVLNEQVPVGATGLLTSTPQGTCTPGPIGVSCALGTIAAGASVQATVSFITNLTGTLSTTAVVTSTTPDSVIENNRHTIGAVIVPAGQGVDLRLTKVDSLDPVGVNQPFVYTLTLSNVGTAAATNVVVTDNVPAGISITYATSASGMCSAVGAQVLCSFASLLPGQAVTMTFTARGTSTGLKTNQASVTSAQIELNPADNVVSETTMVADACAATMFAGPLRFAAPTGLLDVIPGDLNGDGAQDLVGLSYSLNAVVVYLGDGLGGFGAPTPYPAGDRPIEGVLVDLNLDGRLDLAIEGQVNAFVLLGNGSGGFQAPVEYTFPGAVRDVRAGDFNADDRPDLVVAVPDTNSLYILTGLAAGGFAAPVPISLPGPPHRIAVDDLNHDGRPDLAVAYVWSSLGTAPADDSVSVLLANGNGGFSAPAAIPLQVANFSRVFAIGDINGDTHRDLAVVEITASGRLLLLYGNGAGNFSVQQLINVPGNPINFSVASGDLNGDGRLDLVASTGEAHQMLVWQGNGAGGFAAPLSYVAPSGYEVRLADFNGDGRPDAAIGTSQGLTVFLNGCGQAVTNLVLSAFDSPDPVDEGAVLSYSSQVTNAGGVLAANVTLTQMLPGAGVAVSATSSQGTCSISGRVVTCTLGSLAPNASANVQVTFRPSAAGSLSSLIGVGSDRPDSSQADNATTLTTEVTGVGRQLVVTNTGNAGPGSLRQAIIDSNSDSGDRDEIVFNIPGSGVRTITLLSALPVIAQPVVIDGTTQPGFGGTPIVELNGNGLSGSGLAITAGNSVVRGLVINRFAGAGILVLTNGGNLIEGNYIGTNAAGTADLGNTGDGIAVMGGSGTVIGGTTAAARNIVSGNDSVGIRLNGVTTTGNFVLGNYVGVNASGVAAIGNGATGVAIGDAAHGNTVGGNQSGAGNVISGNGNMGVTLFGAGVNNNRVAGNRIGTDDFATTSIPNAFHGVNISDGTGNVIGGIEFADRNVISGNTQSGVSISGATATGNLVANNFIGTNGSGMSGIGNNVHGVIVTNAPGNTIGTPDAGNVIAGNGQNGIAISGASAATQIYANRIGVNSQSTSAIANALDGIRIDGAASTVIGGVGLARNTIGGNGQNGIGIYSGPTGTPAPGTQIVGNTIGFRSPPNTVGNGVSGIHLASATNTVIGGATQDATNLISWNGRNGVTILSGFGNRILGTNTIADNTVLGIDLGNNGVTPNDAGDVDDGVNNLQNFPLLTAAVGGVQGVLNSEGNAGFMIRYFANTACDASGNGEGQTFLGELEVITPANGSVTLPLFAAPAGTIVTATATNSTNNTSEFSACVTVPIGPQTFTVTNTNDSGPGSLRQAILAANARAGTLDRIWFDIPGTAPFTIALQSALPTISDPVMLDGFTQPGYAGVPLVGLSGAAAGVNVAGLRIAAGSSTVRGLAINGFSGDGIAILNAAGNVIHANYIGTNIAGTAALANGIAGIRINSAGNTIGGTTTAEVNLISGNTGPGIQLDNAATNTSILGNRIGTNAAGTAAVANGAGINVGSSHGNSIGGSATGAGNLISGNTGNGIWINASNNNQVVGNRIGVNAAGSGAIANGYGMFVMGANNVVAGNVISGNTNIGISVAVGSTATVIRGNRIGTTSAATGSSPLPNGSHGVFLDGTGTVVGGATATDANVIANNGQSGVRVNSGTGHSVLRNSVFANAQLGIDVGPGGLTANDTGDADTGANNLQNFPVLTAAPGGVQGTFNSTPGATFTVQFFGSAACDSSGSGEGQTFLGSSAATTDGTGDAVIPFFAVSPVQVVTATATSDGGDTSEFSVCVTSLPPNGRPVANAGSDQSGYVGRLVTLTGTGNDPDDDDLTYAWSFTSRPTGSQAALANATQASSTFTPDVAGTYTIQLVVDDGTDSSTPDSVVVTVLSNELALALVGAQVVGVTREAPVRVTLPFAAPAGGTTVTLTSANPSFLSVVAPGTAFIPAGQTDGQVMVRGEGSGTAGLRANATGYGQGTLSVVVTHNLISTPPTLNVAFGGSTALPINIGPDPAPAGGLTLNIASSDADIEVLTPQVTVPGGALSVNATVRGARVGTANVTVSSANYAPSTTIVTSRAELNIVQTTAAFNQGLAAPVITVRLESNGTQIAAQPALTVALTAANTSCVTVPASVTIPAGLVSATFTPAYGGTATLPCTTTVTASATDVTADTVTITVNRPATIDPPGTVTVGAGLMTGTTASLNAAQHGGLDVTISAGSVSQPGPVRLSRTAAEAGTQSITVHLNNGQTSISYYVHALENTTGSSTISLSAEGVVTGSHTVEVVQPAVEILNLNGSMNTLSGADTDVYVQVGITHPSYNNAQLYTVQNVRAGSPGFEVTLTNSNSAVARLRSDEPAATGGQTGQVVRKTIRAGIYYTQAVTTGTSYGFAFEPLGTGTTTVTASAPNALTMTTTGVRQAQVTSPVINAGSNLMVGAGLITTASASLSAAQHGGVDVTITAGAGPVRLSRTPTEVGTQSITVPVANGQTSISYYLQGVENTTGSSTITLTAERFTSDSHTVDVVQPGVEILNLNPSMNTLSGADTDVYVQVGITHPSYNNTQLWQAQSVRPGSPGIEVTLTNSNSAVGRLRSDEPAATGGQTGPVVRKLIPAGTYYTHALTTGTTYGFAFEPLGTGTTAVTASAPGVLTMTATGVRQVQVTSPVVSAGATVQVGAGLMNSAFASLSAAQHGGVDVTITAGTGPVRLSRTLTEVGTQSITMHLANGQTSISYYVHGLENTTGTSTITLTAERFTSASHTVEVVQPAVEILNLGTTYSNLSADDVDVYVQVGITHPTYNNAQLWQVQNVRAGSPGFEVTLTNSNVNVARLRSDEPASTNGQVGQVVRKTIPAGTYYTHAIAAGTAYGLAFEPLGNGSTTVTVSAPGALTMTTTGVRAVTITTPALSVTATTTVGAGLMEGQSVSLGASQHGGVDVTITSSAPSVVLVSPNATTTGTASTVVHVANGLTSVPFVVHGLENANATAVVTLSAPGFTSTTMSVTVTPSSVEIINLSASLTTTAPDDTDLYVQVGITHPSYNNSQLWQVQYVRAGSPGYVVTLTVDNAARARLHSDEPAATGQTVTKPIQPGAYYTQRLVQSETSYGLAFEPLASGTVVVTAAGPPGTQPLASSQRTVVINP